MASRCTIIVMSLTAVKPTAALGGDNPSIPPSSRQGIRGNVADMVIEGDDAILDIRHFGVPFDSGDPNGVVTKAKHMHAHEVPEIEISTREEGVPVFSKRLDDGAGTINHGRVVESHVNGLLGPLKGPGQSSQFSAVAGLSKHGRRERSVQRGGIPKEDSEARTADCGAVLIGAGAVSVDAQARVVEFGQEWKEESIQGRKSCTAKQGHPSWRADFEHGQGVDDTNGLAKLRDHSMGFQCGGPKGLVGGVFRSNGAVGDRNFVYEVKGLPSFFFATRAVPANVLGGVNSASTFRVAGAKGGDEGSRGMEPVMGFKPASDQHFPGSEFTWVKFFAQESLEFRVEAFFVIGKAGLSGITPGEGGRDFMINAGRDSHKIGSEAFTVDSRRITTARERGHEGITGGSLEVVLDPFGLLTSERDGASRTISLVREGNDELRGKGSSEFADRSPEVEGGASLELFVRLGRVHPNFKIMLDFRGQVGGLGHQSCEISQAGVNRSEKGMSTVRWQHKGKSQFRGTRGERGAPGSFEHSVAERFGGLLRNYRNDGITNGFRDNPGLDEVSFGFPRGPKGIDPGEVSRGSLDPRPSARVGLGLTN